MFANFDTFQNFGKAQMEASATTAAEMTKSLQTIATEANDYSKKSLEHNSAFVEKMMGVRKLDEAIALQTDYAKTAYEGFVAQMTRMGELYQGMAKDALKPMETAMAKVKSAA